jgi:hypothetical protein
MRAQGANRADIHMALPQMKPLNGMSDSPASMQRETNILITKSILKTMSGIKDIQASMRRETNILITKSILKTMSGIKDIQASMRRETNIIVLTKITPRTMNTIARAAKILMDKKTLFATKESKMMIGQKCGHHRLQPIVAKGGCLPMNTYFKI